jgi:Ser/Thr protein kinase RdoA (MazF antagonist)
MDDLQKYQEKLSAYVEHRLLARLGLSGRPFALEPAHAGLHSRIFFLTVEQGPQLVLKIIAKRRRFRSALACARHLAQHGIAAPAVVLADEDGRFFNRRGMHVLCEERIAGESLEHLPRTPELIAQVAQLYAGMHATVRGAWGDIKRGKTAGLHASLQKKLLERLDGWGRVEELAPALREKIIAKFAAGQELVDTIRSFSLSHTDPNRNNLILRPSDRKLFLLDTGSLRYLPRAIDYFMLQAYFCFNNPAHGALFEKTYFQGVPQKEIDLFRNSQNFFRLYVVILFLHDLTTRFAALDKSSPYFDEFAGLIPLAKKALMELLETK